MPEKSIQNNTVEFSEKTVGPTTAEWDQDSENTPVFAVVSAVAEVSGTDPLELPALSEVIDPEALNDLFTSRPKSTLDQIRFQYAGYGIVVRGSGEIQIEESHEV